MRKHMIENAAYEVATQVRTVEESIEAALAELAELQSKMVHARSVTNAGFADSHAAFEQLAMAIDGFPGFAEFARNDSDFDPIRNDPRFPA